MRDGVLFAVALFVVTLPAGEVLAEDDTKFVPKEQPAKSESDVDGWNGNLTIGGNVNLSSNDSVVGETDGFTALLGLSLTGALDFTSGSHQWQNSLTINEGFARTPSLGEFVKNTDTFAVETLYQYYFLPWSGIFGESTLDTTLFTTNNVTSEPSDYTINRTDGTQDTFTNTTRFELAGPLKPTSFSESAGVFVKPVRDTAFSLKLRGGVGARETLARGVLTVSDDPETSEIEVTELRNIYQAGAEAFVGAEGSFPDRNVSYKIGAHGLLPVLNNDVEGRGPVELFRYGLNGQVNFDALEWLTVSYTMKVLRDPQLVEETQVQNNLLLNVKYSILQRREPEQEDEEPSPEEQLETAREKAEAAEKRVEELEKKVEEKEKKEQDDATAEGAEDAENGGE